MHDEYKKELIFDITKIVSVFVLVFVVLVSLSEIESERECSLLGKEMGLRTKEYFGIPCMVLVDDKWIPARNYMPVRQK